MMQFVKKSFLCSHPFLNYFNIFKLRERKAYVTWKYFWNKKLPAEFNLIS